MRVRWKVSLHTRERCRTVIQHRAGQSEVTNKDGYFGMVKHIVADRSKDSASDHTETPGTCDDEVGLLFFRAFHNAVPSTSVPCLHYHRPVGLQRTTTDEYKNKLNKI